MQEKEFMEYRFMEYMEKTALGKTERRDPYAGKRVHGKQGEGSLREKRKKRFLRNTGEKAWPHGIQAKDRILKEEGKTLMGYRDTVS
jgi:hypothetical protein